MSYEVERTQYGVVVRGPIPVEDFSALSKGWKRSGLTVLAPGIATALDASFAVTSPDNLEAWQDEVQGFAARRGAGDPELTWLSGTDTGTSSVTMFSVLCSPRLRVAAEARLGPFRPSVPIDPDDFGRCYRLLNLFPAWRERLSEVSARYREWAGLVNEWPKLEALFVEEEPSGRAPKLYDEMQRIRGGR